MLLEIAFLHLEIDKNFTQNDFPNLLLACTATYQELHEKHERKPGLYILLHSPPPGGGGENNQRFWKWGRKSKAGKGEGKKIKGGKRQNFGKKSQKRGNFERILPER